jgi:hypothetical protein
MAVHCSSGGNLLELLSMLPDSPQPELGIVGWSRWKPSSQIHSSADGLITSESPADRVFK